MAIHEDGVYTVEQIAEALHVSRHRVTAWIRCGWLKSFKVMPDARQLLITGRDAWDMIRRFLKDEYPDELGG